MSNKTSTDVFLDVCGNAWEIVLTNVYVVFQIVKTVKKKKQCHLLWFFILISNQKSLILFTQNRKS